MNAVSIGKAKGVELAVYKDIDQVMADAADLVEVEHVLRQILNVKGQ